jgi:CheY-like chemotaxis protein
MTEPKANILLVDDHRENLLALEVSLARLDENLVFANSGEDALKCLLKQQFAVVLLDVQMPGMDGFEMAQLMRQRDQSKHTPIIFLTAIGKDDTFVSKGYSLGAVDYLFKPLVPEILRSKVQVFVDLFKLNHELEQKADELANKAEQLEKQRQTAVNLTLELKRADKAKNEFLANMSHEIRTPMNAVMGLTEIVLQSELDDIQRDYLTTVMDSAESLLSVINDILDFSKIEAGMLQFEQVEFQLHDVVGDTVRSHAVRADKKELELAWPALLSRQFPMPCRGTPVACGRC